MKNFSIDYDIKEYTDPDGNTKYNVEIYDCRCTQNEKKIDISVLESIEIIKQLLKMNSYNIHNRFVSDLIHKTPNTDKLNKSNIDKLVDDFISNVDKDELDKTIITELDTFTGIANDIIESTIYSLLNRYEGSYIGSVIIPVIQDKSGDSTYLRLDEENSNALVDLTSANIDPMSLLDISKNIIDNALYDIISVIKQELKQGTQDKDFIEGSIKLIEYTKKDIAKLFNSYLQEYRNML